MSYPLLSQLEELLASIDLQARGRSGRIAAVTVGAPRNSPEDLGALLRRRLAALGHPDVEVSLRPEPGVMRLLTMEFFR